MEADSSKIADIRQLVVFDLAGEEYGIDIQKVQEIIRMQSITKIPKAQEFVVGVINLRGKVIPVIDLRQRFGLEYRENDHETRIVVVEITGLVIGMIVDAVSQVMRLPEESIEPPSPIVSNIDSDFIDGVGKLEDQLIILLNVEKVLSVVEYQHLAVVAQHSSAVAVDEESSSELDAVDEPVIEEVVGEEEAVSETAEEVVEESKEEKKPKKKK